MSLGFCILAFLAIVFLMTFSFMISFCTHVAEKGYKNDLIEFTDKSSFSAIAAKVIP